MFNITSIKKCFVQKNPTGIQQSADFILLLKTGELLSCKHTRTEYEYGENNLYPSSLHELNAFLKPIYNDVDCIFSSIFNFNLEVENICYCQAREVVNFYLDNNFSKTKNSNCYIGFEHPPFTFSKAYESTYTQVKFLYSALSFYGLSMENQVGDFAYINNPINTTKLRKLKNYQKILWVGQEGIKGGRSHLIEQLQKELNVEIVHTRQAIPKQVSFLDVLIEHECFCVLSLDGLTHQCYRDTYLGFEYVPNFKYTAHTGSDISAGNSIYLATNMKEAAIQLQLLKQDLHDENYSKLIKNHKFMVNARHLWQRKFLDHKFLIACAYKNINIADVILHPLAEEPGNCPEWFNFISNINNIKPL